MGRHDRARLTEIVSGLHKAHADEVDTLSDTEHQIIHILRRERAVGQCHAWRADAFALAERAAVDDPGPNLMSVAQQHFELDSAVIQQQPVPWLHGSRKMRIGSGQPASVSSEFASRDHQLVSGTE